MRIKHDVEKLNYQETKRFFKSRADKYKADNPYSVTMYQDQNPELVRERNQHEVNKLLPFLKLDENSKVLDLACGIGRWADAISCKIAEYCGIDFSEELIDIAKKRNTKPEAEFYSSELTALENILSSNGKGNFNKILMIGIMMYLNDDDIISILNQAEKRCDEHTIFCIREPIGLGDRLTLKDFFSEELKDNYNAIYRTDDEIKNILGKTLLLNGFSITHEGFLFDDSLNNRKETSQYFYILER